MKNFIAISIMILGTLVPSIVIAAVGYAGILALGRNPSSAPKILLGMLIPILLAAGIAIIALIIAFYLFSPEVSSVKG